jgi:hypothetical protein
MFRKNRPNSSREENPDALGHTGPPSKRIPIKPTRRSKNIPMSLSTEDKTRRKDSAGVVKMEKRNQKKPP